MNKNWVSLMLIAAGFAVSLIAFPFLPEQMAVHWNIRGEVDGYAGKWFGAFFAPVISLLLLALLRYLPKIDPKKDNYPRFQGSYSFTIILVLAFLLAIHVLTIGFNLGLALDISRLAPLGVGLLFIGIGNYMPKFKPNYFSGIRTPWTLSNETVWHKTHRFGGKAFVVMGGLTILSILLREPLNWWLLLASVLGGVLLICLKSYGYYKEEQKSVR